MLRKVSLGLILALAACGSARVIQRTQAGGVIELQGDRNKAMEQANQEMAAHCGPNNYTIVQEGEEAIGTDTYTREDTSATAGQSRSGRHQYADSTLSKDEPDFFASLYPATFTACGFAGPAGDHLLLSIPKTPGEYPMSLSRNMTFVVGDDNKIAINGTIVVDEVTATSVKGGLVASFDAANEVNGRFEIPICAE